MYIEEYGPQAAPALVFLHGNAVGGWMWQPFIEEFGDYHCILPDLPGHGKSNALEWISLADTAEQIIQVIRKKASNQRAHLVGASLGGSVAFQILGTCPEVVGHTLITGTSLLPMPGLAFFKITIRLMAPLIKTDFFIQAALKALNFSSKETQQFRQALGAISRKTFVTAWCQALDLRYSKAIEKVETPILLMAGEKEQAFIHRSNFILMERLPNVKSRVAPKMGHGWMGESPRLFTSVLRSWLLDKELPSELLVTQGSSGGRHRDVMPA